MKILILENDPADFNEISGLLQRRFEQDDVCIFPSLSDKSDTIKNWESLVGIMHENKGYEKSTTPPIFDEILKFVNEENINLLIIDNRLIDDGDHEDNTGINLMDFLSKNGKEKRSLVLLTGDDWVSEGFEKIDKVGNFIHKSESEKLITYITDNFDIPKKKEPVTTKIYHWGRNVFSIHLCLKSLVFISLIFGVVNTILQFAYCITSVWPFSKPIKEIEQPHKQDHTVVINFLNLAEGIFLNFLPFFILIGFYSYYNTYLTGILIGSRRDKVHSSEIERATLVLKFSKILFISSIIATLILTILSDLIDGDVTVMRLIAYGLFLVLLIGYWFVLEKVDHAHEKQ